MSEVISFSVAPLSSGYSTFRCTFYWPHWTQRAIPIDFPPLTLNLTHNDLWPYFHTNLFLIRGDKYRIDITNSLCINALFCLTWHCLERSDSNWQFEKWCQLHRVAFRYAASSLKNVFLSVSLQWLQDVFNQNYWHSIKYSTFSAKNTKLKKLKRCKWNEKLVFCEKWCHMLFI